MNSNFDRAQHGAWPLGRAHMLGKAKERASAAAEHAQERASAAVSTARGGAASAAKVATSAASVAATSVTSAASAAKSAAVERVGAQLEKLRILPPTEAQPALPSDFSVREEAALLEAADAAYRSELPPGYLEIATDAKLNVCAVSRKEEGSVILLAFRGCSLFLVAKCWNRYD